MKSSSSCEGVETALALDDDVAPPAARAESTISGPTSPDESGRVDDDIEDPSGCSEISL